MLQREFVQLVVKVGITVAIVVSCSLIGRRLPTLGGLIATAPITTLLVLLWLYSDNPGDYALIAQYTKGVLWGIIPTALFFLTAYALFNKKVGFWVVLAVSASFWLIAAVCHQLLLRK